MRVGVLLVAAWAGALRALQSAGVTAGAASDIDQIARLIGLASVLSTLTVLVYRLGVWRQEMEHTKHDVAAEIKAHRDESTANFDRLERRLDAIDHMMAMAAEQRARSARWRIRINHRLERLEAEQS